MAEEPVEGRRDGATCSDQPADKDALDFDAYFETLADIASDPKTDTPFTIGVFGRWGSGKTSLMQMVRDSIAKRTYAKGYPLVWFDAWKYDREDALWRALILRVVHALREKVRENITHLERDGAKRKDQIDRAMKPFDDLERSLYRVVEREEFGNVQIDAGKMVKGAGKMLLHMGLHLIPAVGQVLPKLLEKSQEETAGDDLSLLFDAVRRERQEIFREHIHSLEQFQHSFATLVRDALGEKGRLIVFIDDLDRCMPEKAIEVLEAIKLFMDAKGCLFVLGLDDEVISRGIELKYRELGWDNNTEEARTRFLIQGQNYLEKIIQLPFTIPKIEPGVMAGYVRSLLTEWPDEACIDVFASGSRANPRQVKRTVNAFLLLWKLAGRRNPDQIKPVLLAKIVAIQHTHPAFFALVRDGRHLLIELERHFREGRRSDRLTEKLPDQARADVPQVASELQRYLSDPLLQELLTLHDARPDTHFSSLTPEGLGIYFTLTRRAETPLVDGAAVIGDADLPIPQMIEIPQGEFRMGSTDEDVKQAIAAGMDKEWVKNEQPEHVVNLSAYRIGKYPVTNRQYQAFVQRKPFRSPAGWQGNNFQEGKGDHPVVHVSWEDANAYCTWLDEVTGVKGFRYRLPTEAQWEKAARWDVKTGKSRIFPWGDNWDAKRLNSKESGHNDTTPIGQFSPLGDSPYGCSDMAGNVWEWCQDWYDEKVYEKRLKDSSRKLIKDPNGPDAGEYRSVRGGSFFNNQYRARCAYRYRFDPVFHDFNVGFRVVLLPFSGEE